MDSGQQRVFNLFREQTLAAGLDERCRLQMIAGSLNNFDARGCTQTVQAGGDMTALARAPVEIRASRWSMF